MNAPLQIMIDPAQVMHSSDLNLQTLSQISIDLRLISMDLMLYILRCMLISMSQMLISMRQMSLCFDANKLYSPQNKSRRDQS